MIQQCSGSLCDVYTATETKKIRRQGIRQIENESVSLLPRPLFQILNQKLCRRIVFVLCADFSRNMFEGGRKADYNVTPSFHHDSRVQNVQNELCSKCAELSCDFFFNCAGLRFEIIASISSELSPFHNCEFSVQNDRNELYSVFIVSCSHFPVNWCPIQDTRWWCLGATSYTPSPSLPHWKLRQKWSEINFSRSLLIVLYFLVNCSRVSFEI